jgi:hypothetical protein
MEFDEIDRADSVLFTEHGELRFYENPKPKFVFFNSRAKKPDLLCYSSTIRSIANHLPDAQDVARRYIASKKENTPVTGDKAGNDSAKEVVDETGASESAGKRDEVVFSKVVSEYGSEIQIKNNLLVNIYNDRPRIWLKPWWRDTKDGSSAAWLPSNAGYQFSLFDSGRDLVAFADKCMIKYRKGLNGDSFESKKEKELDVPAFDPAEDKSLLEFLDSVMGLDQPPAAALEPDQPASTLEPNDLPEGDNPDEDQSKPKRRRRGRLC